MEFSDFRKCYAFFQSFQELESCFLPPPPEVYQALILWAQWFVLRVWSCPSLHIWFLSRMLCSVQLRALNLRIRVMILAIKRTMTSRNLPFKEIHDLLSNLFKLSFTFISQFLNEESNRSKLPIFIVQFDSEQILSSKKNEVYIPLAAQCDFSLEEFGLRRELFQIWFHQKARKNLS